MEKTKKLALYFPDLARIHLYKDVIQLPYYLSKAYDLDVSVYYLRKKKEELPEKYKGIKLCQLCGNTKNRLNSVFMFRVFKYITSPFLGVIRKKAKEIDILMFYHFGFDKYPIIKSYKKHNKNGKIYLKLDANTNFTEIYGSHFAKKDIVSLVKRRIMIYMIRQTELFSCETKNVYNLIRNNPLWQYMKEKLAIIPNGFDYEEILDNKIKIKPYEEKENIFCVVGRLSAPEKNVSLILEAIKKIDLKDWKLLLVGPIENNSDFGIKLSEFQNSGKTKNIVITGNVLNRKTLFDIYNKSKCFILSSNSESFGNVLLEAGIFGNYIISTRVGGASDITNNEELGSIIEPGNIQQLSSIMKSIINKEIDIKSVSYSLKIKVNQEFTWGVVVNNEAYRRFFGKTFVQDEILSKCVEKGKKRK